MGKLDKVVADLEALPTDVRDAIVVMMEDMIARHGRTHSLLTESQADEVERRLADPGPDLSDAETEELFAELMRE